MERFNGYVMSIVCVSVIVAILMAVVPKGPSKTLAGIASGFLLILVLCRPLAGLSLERLSETVGMQESAADTGRFEYEQDKLLKEIIVEKTSAYILAKAQALGVDCQASVILSGDQTPIPVKVVISGPVRPPGGKESELADMIERDLGVLHENQYYEWG